MKELITDRPLVFLDLETTGLNVRTDRIVEITVLKMHPDGREESITKLVNPQIPIPEEAVKIHGITDEKVLHEPGFRQIAKSFFQFLEDCDLCGFNIKKYDLPLLTNEFKRYGFDFNKTGRRIIDLKIIFHKYYPRDLETAYQVYCDKVLVNSHSSDADARACAEILESQLRIHKDLPRSLNELHQYCCNPDENNWVDPEGKFIFQGEDIYCNFGNKHKGRKLSEIAKIDPGYLEWIEKSDFSVEVKDLANNALNESFPRELS
jgi:DNA polymerase-3 subunit epsilon